MSRWLLNLSTRGAAIVKDVAAIWLRRRQVLDSLGWLSLLLPLAHWCRNQSDGPSANCRAIRYIDMDMDVAPATPCVCCPPWTFCALGRLQLVCVFLALRFASALYRITNTIVTDYGRVILYTYRKVGCAHVP